jgi:transcriptional regulator with XRE-family HTH domain
MAYLDEYYRDPERMRSFQQERLITEITQLMCRAMREQKVSRAQLAEKLGLTKGRVSQILNGHANLTLRTTADIFNALSKTLVFKARERFILESVKSKNVTRGTVGWDYKEGKTWLLQNSIGNADMPCIAEDSHSLSV